MSISILNPKSVDDSITNQLYPSLSLSLSLGLVSDWEFSISNSEKMAMPNCAVSMNDAQLFQFTTGIQHLAETRRFKVWFLDQYGVLHDGQNPYPGAISALEKLAKSGAKMVVLSNSPRRASATYEKMRSMGFDLSLFSGVITSGELTYQYLERRDDPWFASLGRSCIHMTWNDPGYVSLDGLGLRVVDNIEEAEFILAHGTGALGTPSGSPASKQLEELEEILEKCAVRKIPMVVANPDYAAVDPKIFAVMPGALGAKYEQLGGEVMWMGKPGKVIYERAMAMAGVNASECIGVGDSLHHDIKGANIAGMQSILIPGGIHRSELGLDHFGQVPEPTKVQELAIKCDAYPTFVVPAFTW